MTCRASFGNLRFRNYKKETQLASNEPPITRSDLREELDRSLRHYPTKADLANAKLEIAVFLVGVISVAVAADKLLN